MNDIYEEDQQIEYPEGEEVRFTFRTVCLVIFGILLLNFVITSRLSEMNVRVRLSFAAMVIFGLFTAAVFLVRYFITRPRTLYPVFFFIMLFIVWTVLGNRQPDVEGLRTNYMNRLTSFENVHYVWGGESHGGIDCSGLPRVALWQAMFREGVKELNPRLLGPGLWSFWWHDINVSDIESGKYGFTKVVGYAPRLAGYDTSELMNGDMAVASDAPALPPHVLIYIGENRWIEANYRDGKVVINTASTDSKRGYFNTPVTLVRWKVLEPAAQGGQFME